MSQSVKVTVLPYKAPRKTRRQETNRFCVKWGANGTVYFRWFKRDSAAVAFLNRRIDDGIQARLIML